MICIALLFQFHKGSIKTDHLFIATPAHFRFNSTKVRLRLLVSTITSKSQKCFNSTKVRLRQAEVLWPLTLLWGFNSTKVRLRLLVFMVWKRHLLRFNSTKVRLRHTIKIITMSTARFQFHKGSIKTHYRCIYNGEVSSFNSTKVRLRLLLDSTLIRYATFQFHKGSIKTPRLCSTPTSHSVSIPQRFD